MSRSFVRVLAVAAGLALLPVAQLKAQAANCTFNQAVPSSPSCALTVSASVSVPKLGRLAIDDSTLTFPAPNWASFLTDSQPATVVVNLQINHRTNASHNLTLTSSGWASGAWDLADVTYGYNAAACTDNSTAPTTLTGSNALVTGGAATNNTQRFLCLALTYPGNLNDPKLAPGSFSLPMTLTLAAP